MSPNLPTNIDATAAARMLGMPPTVFYRHAPKEIFLARGLVDVRGLVDWINSCRVGIENEAETPSSLLSEKDVGTLFPMFDGGPSSPARVRRFCRRALFPVPHYDFGRSCKRFPRGAVEWWWSYYNSPVPVGMRRYKLGDKPYQKRQRRAVG